VWYSVGGVFVVEVDKDGSVWWGSRRGRGGGRR